MDNGFEREPWLLVQEGSKLSLLAQDHQAYYLIAVNKRLTADAEEQLARCGSITKVRLEEMGLTFRTLPKNQVRGVALTGSEAGETVYFYTTSGKKQKYVFSDDYDPEQTDAFFAGKERFTPPGKKQKKSKDPESWRTERQDPALYEKFGYISPALTVLSIGCGAGYIVYRNWIWFLAALAAPVAAVVLEIIFPAYFTLISEKNSKKKAHNLMWPLLVHAMIIVFLPEMNWLNDAVYGILWVVCGAAAVLVMLLAEEFRRRKSYLFVVFIIAGLIAMFDIGNINRLFDFSEPKVYTLTVEELYFNEGSYDDSYECFVTLPDGRQAQIDITRKFYNTLEIGDPIRVEVSDGALGIAYANAYPIE